MTEQKEENKEEKKYKGLSRWVLFGLSLTVLFLAYSSTKLEFNYDFEKFFPQEDDDLSFYKDYRTTFENDNDFILIGLVNEEGIFQQDFLQQAERLAEELRELPHLREVISPLEMKYYEFSSFGMKENSFFHINSPQKYAADSLRLIGSVEPVAEMLSLENNSLILIVKNIQLISKEKSDELALALQEVVDQQQFDELHVMGKIMGQKAYIDVMKNEFVKFSAISIFVLFIFLIITYRAAWGIVIPLITVALAAVGSLGFMQLSGSKLNMMTTLLPIIMLVVGMSDVVHLISKYLEEIRLGRTKVVALKNMLKKVGVATLLTSLTTALGFVTLIGVDMEPIRDFGIFTAVGVLLAFVLSILFIPSIFLFVKKPRIAQVVGVNTSWDKGLGKIFVWLCRNRKKVLVGYLLIAITSIIGATQIKFDYFLMQDLGEDDPLMLELYFFQEQFGGIRPFELAILPQGEHLITDYEVIKEVQKLEEYLKNSYGVNQMISPTLPYKYLNKTLRSNQAEFYKIPDNPKRFKYLKKQMQKFEGREEWAQIISEDQKMGRIFGRLIDPGSREMSFRNKDLREYFNANINTEVLDFRLTGTPVIIDESSRSVSGNIFYGLLIAFGLIGLSMGILFRSIKMAFLSLVPNLFPILLTAGYIGFASIPLNMSTAIVFTIAFGIAVDDTIHFLSRYRQEMKLGRSNLLGLRRTFISTGKAIIITSIILMGGFGALIFSDFLSTFYIGLFVSMTLIFAVITDLTLLPVLLLGDNRKKK